MFIRYLRVSYDQGAGGSVCGKGLLWGVCCFCNLTVKQVMVGLGPWWVGRARSQKDKFDKEQEESNDQLGTTGDLYICPSPHLTTIASQE